MEKWLSMVSLGGRVMEGFALRRFLMGLAQLIILAVVLGVMIGIALVTIIYGCSMLLEAQGYSSAAAILISGVATLGIAGGVALYLFRYIRRALGGAMAERIKPVTDAFLQGFMTRQ